MHKTASGRWVPDRDIPRPVPPPSRPELSPADLRTRILMLAARGSLELPNSPFGAFAGITMRDA